MNLSSFSLAASVVAVVLFSPSLSRADVAGSGGGHHGEPLICGNPEVDTVGAVCDATASGSDGLCQSTCGDAGSPDGGACALTCVANPMHGARSPAGGALRFLAPWVLAMVVPLALRKRRRA